MSDTAFQAQYRQEFIAGFEQHQSLLRDCVTTEVQVKGNQAIFLVADSGGATAVTRGVNGRIPGRPDNLNQYTCTLQEWHDVPERTGFNLFASQSDGRRIMQMTSYGVMNRKADSQIINELNNGTVNTGTAKIASLRLVTRSKAILGAASVPSDGGIHAVVTPAFMAYLSELKEFSNAQWVDKKPMEMDDPHFKDKQGYYVWQNVKWIEHSNLPGVGTSAAKCFMFHRSAIGHAAPGQLFDTYADYDKREDLSYCRVTAYMNAKLLQNSGVVVINHDDSAMVAG